MARGARGLLHPGSLLFITLGLAYWLTVGDFIIDTSPSGLLDDLAVGLFVTLFVFSKG